MIAGYNKAESFFDEMLMSTRTWITEKELAREIKKQTNKQTKKSKVERTTRKKFYSGGEKMRNDSGQRGEKSAL